MQRLQPGQRKPAPARLFAQRSSKEEYVNKDTEQGQRGQGTKPFKRSQDTRNEDHAEDPNHGDTNEGEQVPPKAHPPQHEPTQKAAYSLPPFDRARHDERRQEWAHKDANGRRPYQQSQHRATELQDPGTMFGEHIG